LENARRDLSQIDETVFSRNYRVDSNPPVLTRQADDNGAMKHPGRDGSTRGSIEGTNNFPNALGVHSPLERGIRASGTEQEGFESFRDHWRSRLP